MRQGRLRPVSLCHFTRIGPLLNATRTLLGDDYRYDWQIWQSFFFLNIFCKFSVNKKSKWHFIWLRCEKVVWFFKDKGFDVQFTHIEFIEVMFCCRTRLLNTIKRVYGFRPLLSVVPVIWVLQAGKCKK